MSILNKAIAVAFAAALISAPVAYAADEIAVPAEQSQAAATPENADQTAPSKKHRKKRHPRRHNHRGHRAHAAAEADANAPQTASNTQQTPEAAPQQ